MLSIFYDWFIKVYKSIYFPNDVFASLEELNEVSEGVLDSSFFGMVTAIILTVGLGIMLCYFVVDLFEKNACIGYSVRGCSSYHTCVQCHGTVPIARAAGTI